VNPHLQRFIETYERAGGDYQQILTWHLAHGAVFSSADAFALGYHADSGRDFAPVEYPHSDTLFVVWCSGDMLSAVMAFVDRYEYVAWTRDFKNSPRVRCHRMSDIFKKLT